MELIILWAASPLLLIPLCIFFGRRKSKLETFINELLRIGRINSNEFRTLRAEITPNIPAEEKNIMSPAEKLPIRVNTDFTSPRQSAEKEKVNAACQPAESKPMSTAQTQKTGSASVLFGIGVAFVILAGFIFSTAIWVYLSDLARTGIIALAGLIFFGISSLAQKKFRLENTSNAFYMLGSVFSVITFITAGFFRLFGEWFSLDGGGCCLFFSGASLVLSAFSAFGAKQYSKNIYTYSSLFSASAAVTLVFGQLCTDYNSFVLSVSIFAAVLTAVRFYFKGKSMMEIPASVTHVLIVMRVLYACISLPLLIEGLFEFSGSAFALCVIYLAELTLYGLIKKSRFILSCQSIFAFAISFELYILLDETTANEEAVQFLFSLMIIGIAFLYRYVKLFYTPFAEKLFISIAFINSLDLLDYAAVHYGVLSMLAVEAILFAAALSFGSIMSIVYRMLLPVPLIIITSSVAGHIYSELYISCGSYAFVICSALFTIIAAACISAMKGDRRFALIKYSFEFLAGAVLIYAAASEFTGLSLVLVILLSIAVFAEIQTSDKNIHSVIPMIALFGAAAELISYTSADYIAAGNTSVIVSLSLCALLTFASRMLFSKNIHITNNGKSHWDTVCTGIIMCTFLANHKSFIILTELAVFTANLYRKNHSRRFNSTVVTASAALFSLALINRPFMIIEDAIFASKITILIVTAFGFAVRKIWRRNEKFSESFSSGVYMLAYAMLLFDALINETLFNTLIVLCTSLIILLYSFMKKKKRWFITSAIGLAGLTLYITKDFLSEIDWWVYLLLVGILLISIAAANEYFKGRGESVKQKAGRFLEDWEW